MAIVTLNIDTSTGNLLTSQVNGVITNSIGIPLFAGDSGMTLNVYLLTPIQSANINLSGYTIIPTAGNTLVVYLDNGENPLTTGGAANPNYIVYTQQVAFSTVAGQYFTGLFPLNTTAIAGLFTTNDSANAWLHIGVLNGGNTQTVLYVPVTLYPGVGNMVAPVPTGLTPLSQQGADMRYVQLIGPAGVGFILTTPNGKQLLIEAIDSGGAAVLQSNPIN